MRRPAALSLLLSPRNKCDRPSYYWVELPESSFGIQYELPKPITSKLSPSSSIGEDEPYQEEPHSHKSEPHSPTKIFSFDRINLSPRKPKRRKKKTPFEVMMKRLNMVTSRFPPETGILYLREILEPGDPEFYANRIVRACLLKESQVQRLKVLLLPRRREEILVQYLDHYKSPTHQSLKKVLQHFGGFQKRYAACNTLEERFDLLFGFSFCLSRYSQWMYDEPNNRSRERIVSALARHWRHLLRNYAPPDFGLDPEFSFPALLHFLNQFRQQIETIDMQGLPPLKFVFETMDNNNLWKNECRVSFEDDSFSVSTVTTMTSGSL